MKSVRDAGGRALFPAAVRELRRGGPPYRLGRLRRLMRVEEHFQTLLLYDQLEFLRGSASVTESDRDLALTVQRICLEAANGFQRFLRHREEWATAENASLRFRVTGLALNAIHCIVKWGCFLAEPGRSVPWKQLHALYFLAESEGYAQVPFVLHAAVPTFRPSVQSLYLRTLILDLVNRRSSSSMNTGAPTEANSSTWTPTASTPRQKLKNWTWTRCWVNAPPA